MEVNATSKLETHEDTLRHQRALQHSRFESLEVNATSKLETHVGVNILE
jgi:hypothetical protein